MKRHFVAYAAASTVVVGLVFFLTTSTKQDLRRMERAVKDMRVVQEELKQDLSYIQDHAWSGLPPRSTQLTGNSSTSVSLVSFETQLASIKSEMANFSDALDTVTEQLAERDSLGHDSATPFIDERLDRAAKSLKTDTSSEDWFWSLNEGAAFELKATPSYVTSVACRGRWCRVEVDGANVATNLVGELDLIADMTKEAGTQLRVRKGKLEQGRAVFFLSPEG